MIDEERVRAIVREEVVAAIREALHPEQEPEEYLLDEAGNPGPSKRALKQMWAKSKETIDAVGSILKQEGHTVWADVYIRRPGLCQPWDDGAPCLMALSKLNTVDRWEFHQEWNGNWFGEMEGPGNVLRASENVAVGDNVAEIAKHIAIRIQEGPEAVRLAKQGA